MVRVVNDTRTQLRIRSCHDQRREPIPYRRVRTRRRTAWSPETYGSVMTTREPTEHSPASGPREDEPPPSPTHLEGTVTKTGPRAWAHRHLPFLAMAIPWLSAVYAVAGRSTMEVFTLGLGVLLIGAPICLAGTTTSTLRRRRRLSSLFRRQGWLYALLSGRWLSILVWMALGLGMSFVLLLQIHVYEQIEWAILAATIPLFTVVFAFIQRRLLKAGLHADMAVTEALVWSRWICPAMLLVLHVAAMMWWGDLPRHESVEAAVAAHTPESAVRSGSALVRESLHWAGYFDGLKAYALSHLVWCPLNTRCIMTASSSSRRPSCRADANFPLWFSLTINANSWSPSPSRLQCRTVWYSGPASSWPVRRV